MRLTGGVAGGGGGAARDWEIEAPNGAVEQIVGRVVKLKRNIELERRGNRSVCSYITPQRSDAFACKCGLVVNTLPPVPSATVAVVSHHRDGARRCRGRVVETSRTGQSTVVAIEDPVKRIEVLCHCG